MDVRGFLVVMAVAAIIYVPVHRCPMSFNASNHQKANQEKFPMVGHDLTILSCLIESLIALSRP
jgi:hypothetical protein